MADEEQGQEGEGGTATVEAEGTEGAEERQGAEAAAEGQDGGEGEGKQDGGKPAGSRAEERIRKLANENKTFREQLQQYQQRIQELETPAEKRAAAEKAKEEAKRFYQDPAGYVQQTREELRQEFDRMVKDQRDLATYQIDLEQLKGAPVWNKELNDAMVKTLERYGLTDKTKLAALGGRSKALRLAYEATTGKEWGHWAQDGYSTRLTKERLSRPGSGGAGGGRGQAISPEQYRAAMDDLARRNMDPDEQSREMQKLNAALDAWAAAQG